MGWLSNWLQELIMIVLLATFVEMLLPNRSMERYVKLVLSLLILLTLLSPLTKLLRSDPVAELKRAMSTMGDMDEGNATLEQILAEGKKLRAGEQEQSLQWTARELSSAMKDQIEEETGKRVQSVEVQLGMELHSSQDTAFAQAELPVIRKVLVTMAAQNQEQGKEGAGQETEAGTRPMNETDPAAVEGESLATREPIEIGEVHIPAVQVGVDDNAAGDEPNDQESGTLPAMGEQEQQGIVQENEGSPDSKLTVQIMTLLSENWDVDASKVHVQEQQGARPL